MAAGTTHRPRAAGRNATRRRPALPRRSDQRTCRRPCCTTRQAMGGPAQFARMVAELHRSRSLAPAGSSVASRRADTTDVDGLSSSRPTPLMAPDGPARRRRPGVICELRTARPCSGGFAIIHVRSANPLRRNVSDCKASWGAYRRLAIRRSARARIRTALPLFAGRRLDTYGPRRVFRMRCSPSHMLPFLTTV